MAKKLGCQEKKHSDETKKKMSDAKKGKPAWNKGIKMEEETKIKLSKSLSGKNHPNYGKSLSINTKLKIGKIHKNKIVSDETKEKQRKSHLGQIPWNKGLKLK